MRIVFRRSRMIVRTLPDEAYQLAAEYGLGEPVRMYRTDKRPLFKILAWSMVITYLILFTVVIIDSITHSFVSFTPKNFLFYDIMAGLVIAIAMNGSRHSEIQSRRSIYRTSTLIQGQ